MSKSSSAPQESASQIISRLVEISSLDTLYRDLYFQRARELMSSLLSRTTYIRTKDSLASLGWVERQLRAAVERGDWKKAGELTERVRATRASANASAELMGLAEAVYDRAADIPMDPFASGLQVFFGDSQKLKELREQALGILSALERTDTAKRDFYARRHADFQALKITFQAAYKQEEEAAAPADLQQEALSALESGDLSQLDSLVRQLMNKAEAKEVKQETASVKLAEVNELGDDLLFTFSEETLAAASRLGLAAARTLSRRHFAHLIPYGWQPSFLKSESKRWAREQLARLTFPSDATDKAREAMEFFLLHLFINSGGTRYQVCLVVEDLLLEDFAEPEPKAAMPRTELLSALGLESRWGLTRIDIENALLQHGPRILQEELKLDAEAFRLVAIPPDIYTHLGPARGWGQQEMWTHFDGYWVREGGKLDALAGGDKRFGGTHNIINLNPAYTTDKVLARFAVVQRKRMTTWHQH
jgi:hypothetical protein